MVEKKDRSDWVVKRCSSFEEMRVHRVKQWQDLPFMRRMDAAWEIMEESWKIKKMDLNELRLQRSVATVVRRAS